LGKLLVNALGKWSDHLCESRSYE